MLHPERAVIEQPELLDASEPDRKDTSAIAVMLEKKSLFADQLAAKAAVTALETEVAKLKESGINCAVAEVDKDARLRRRQLISLCTRGDKHRKDTNAPHQRVIDANNTLWNEIEPRIRALVPVFDAPIKAEEERKAAEAKAKAEAERARVEALKAKLSDITNKPVKLISASAETLAAEIKALEGLDITVETFSEFAGDAAVERDGSLEALRVLHANKVKAEADARAAEEARIAKAKADEEAAALAKKQADEIAELHRQLNEANAAKTKAEAEARAATDASAETATKAKADAATEAGAGNEAEQTAATQESSAAHAFGYVPTFRAAPPVTQEVAAPDVPRPTAAEIIKVIGDHFCVDSETVIGWLSSIDLSGGAA